MLSNSQDSICRQEWWQVSVPRLDVGLVGSIKQTIGWCENSTKGCVGFRVIAKLAESVIAPGSRAQTGLASQGLGAVPLCSLSQADAPSFALFASDCPES